MQKKGVEAKQALLENARDFERQSQVKADTARRQLDWEIDQKKSLELEISRLRLSTSNRRRSSPGTNRKPSWPRKPCATKTSKLEMLSLDDIQDQVTVWGTRSAVGKLAVSDARARVNERHMEIQRLQEQKEKSDQRLPEIDASLIELENERENLRNQTAGINSQLDELRELIAPAEKTLELSVAKEGEWQNRETGEQTALSRVDRAL